MNITIPNVPWRELLAVAVIAGIAVPAYVHRQGDQRGALMYPGWDRLDCPYGEANQNVSVICYMRHDRFMMVRVGGTELAYCNVPADFAAQFLAAEDKADFYNRNVRDDATADKYTCVGKTMPLYV